ncbi:hypothetical protein [Serratia phage X20]|uniref:Uncharacterized protein n=1 Tax=Serratia phage X20 TaxID=2006942 RepID=A0A1Z1LZ66_9CAUD|nr:hypothetical protein KNT72_gp268 [Serratia phage X20]ARW58120.1 hypothetical protein [Serratia phage X20]
MKTYKEYIQTEVIAEVAKGAISASEAKTAEAQKLAKALIPILKKGAPLESQLTKLSDEAREIGHKEVQNAVDDLRKVLSPALHTLSRFTKA